MTGRRALAGSAAIALAAHLSLALFQGSLPGARVMALIGAALLLVTATRLSGAPRPVRTIVALGAPFLVWWGLLEGRLAFGSVYAAGLLFVLAAATIHAAALLVRLRAGAVMKRVALLVAGILTGAFLGESLVRTFVPVSVYEIVSDGLFEPDCIVEDGDVTRLTPGFRGEYRHPEFPGLRIEVNDLGLRDGLDETPPDEDDVSVLVLGDSFVFGTGVTVDETFHERLERHADTIAPGRTLRVYGAGVPGHGQVHSETMLERLAPLLRPDVVVVAIYEGNDLEENMKLEGRRLGRVASIEEDERRVAEDRRAGQAGLDLGTFLRGVTRAPFWLGSSSAVQLVLPGLEDRLVRWGWVRPFVPSNQIIMGMLRTEAPDFVRIGVVHLELVLGRLRTRCTALGAEMVVLVIPCALQAVPRRFEQFVEQRPTSARDGFDRRKFHDALAARLRSDGHTVVDTIDRLESSAKDEEEPFLREGHWNAAGHRIAAELLAPALSKVVAAREE